jgi:UDP-glucose 4-epimerase
MPETNAELISRRAEDMAAQIADQMAVAHELNDQAQIDWLHSLIQHLVVIRQAALAIREEAEVTGSDGGVE